MPRNRLVQPLGSRRMTLCSLSLLVSLTGSVLAADTELANALKTMQEIGKLGQGHPQAIASWQTISTAKVSQLTTILASMNDENPLANNWLRAAVETIASRTLSQGGKLPVEQLEAYLADTSHSPRSRSLVFDWLSEIDPSVPERWIPQFINDPSLELRRMAVAQELDKAATLAENNDVEGAIAVYQNAFQHARDLDQVEAAAEALRERDQQVDVAKHFGFVRHWHLVGPFDNTDTVGFDRVYPPEQEVDLQASYQGKGQEVAWQAAETDDELGVMNLNELLGKHKGSVAYAATTFESADELPVELRLGCINANKIWLNGELLTANHVYHAGEGIDQYVGKGSLRAGPNTILLKICQNEQTEAWAQDWQFQLRVCDALGTAILPLSSR